MRWLLALASLAPSATGCDDCTSTSSPSHVPPTAGAAAPASSAKAGYRRVRTTNPRIAARALDKRVEHGERLVKQAPEQPAGYETLLPALLERASFYGKVSDLPRALELSEKALALRPQHPDVRLLHARTLSAVHRFDEALKLLGRAEDESREHAARTRVQRGGILLALGRYDDAL